MAFDLSSASEVGGFDVESAKPFEFDLASATAPDTSLWEDIKIPLAQATNALDTGFTLAGAGLGTLVGDKNTPEQDDALFRAMEERQKSRTDWANPRQAEQSYAAKLGGTLATLPVQMAALPGQSAERMKQMIDMGESTEAAQKAGLVDTALNIGSVALPAAVGTKLATKMLTGAGANVATGAASDLYTQSVAEQDATKKAYDPTNLEARSMEAIIGAGFGAVARTKPVAGKVSDQVKSNLDALDKAKEEQKRTQGEGTLYVGKDGDVTNELPTKITESPEQLEAARTELERQLQEKATRNVEGQQLELLDESGKVVERQQELDLAPRTEETLGDTQAAPDASSLVGPDTPPSKVAPWNDFLAFLAKEKDTRPNLPVMDAIKRQMDMRSRIFDDNSLNTDLPRTIVKPDGSVDVRDILTSMADNEYISTVRKDLVNLMQDLGPYVQDVKVFFKDAPDVNPGKGRNAPAFYTAVDHAIVAGTKGWNARIMMHELVHAATVRAITAHTKQGSTILDHAPQTLKDLNKIFNHVRSKAQQTPQGYYLEGGRIYGLENIKEFASEVMTNRYLQKIMNEMSAKDLGLAYKETSVLKAFFNAVGRLFGVKDQNVDTLLKHSMSLIGDLAHYQKTNKVEIEKFLRKYNPISSQNMRSLISEMGHNPDRPDATRSVKISTPETTKAAQIEKVSGETYIPENPKIDDNLIAKIAKEPDGSNTWNLTPGANARAELANSTLVKTVYRLMNNAYKRAEYDITKMVKPAQDTFISILRNPQKAIVSHDILMREMKKGNDYTAEELRAAGVSDDIIKAHLEFRAMMQDALEKQNRVLRDKGLPEVTALESYVSSRWSGPWRVNIKDSEGNVVWQVAEHSKKKAMDAVEWIKQKEPNLVYDEPKYRKGFERGDNVEAGYLDMLKVLDKDDPRVATLESIYKDYLLNNTENVSSQEKHFLKKKGVRGFAGDRAWSDTDIRDFFEQQFTYAENAYRWSESQKSMEDVKKLINNKDLQESQKNNIQFSKEYVKNQLGFGKSEAFEAIDNGAARLLGTSPQELQKYLGAAKTLFYLSKLGLSLPFTVTQFLQPAITTPGWHSKLSTEGIKHNPIQTTFKSMYGGAQAALWHYGTFFNSPELTRAAEKTMSKLDIEAARYMEANGVVDINPMTDIKKGLRPAAVNAVAAPFEFTIKHSEVVARSMAFMGFVDHLKQSGKYDMKSKAGRLELFQKAEDMTNLSMTDYRTQERALVFEKMGLTGDAAATLHSYQINNLMQLLKFGQEAANGNPRPLFMMVAMQAMAAGLTGLWFIDDLDDLINNLKKLLPHDQYMKVKDFSLKNLMVQNLPDIASYGLVSAVTGTNIHTRMNASDQIPIWPFESTEDPVKNIAGVFPFAQDTINTGLGLATAVSPSSSPKERMAGLYQAAPTVAKGPMENLPQFERGGVALNPKNLQEGQIRRTEKEKSLRNYGLRSIREQKQKDSEFALSKVERQLQDRVKSQSTKAMDYITSGDPKRAVEHLIKYDQLGGDPQEFINRIPQAKMAEMTTELQRRALQTQGGSKASILKYQRYLQQVQ